MIGMKSRGKSRWTSRLSVSRLENRLAPAVTSLISRADPLLFSDTAGMDYYSSEPRPSADGRYTVFTSAAGSLIPGLIDNNGTSGTDIFVYDREFNTTELISHAPGSTVATSNGGSYFPTISADGRYVVFESTSTDIIVGGVTLSNSNVENVFMVDRANQSCVLVTHQYGSTNIGSNTYLDESRDIVKISTNGQVIIFSSQATNLDPAVPNMGYPYFGHAYAFVVATGKLTLLDHQYGNPAKACDQGAVVHDVSADGRYIVFGSGATNLTSQKTGKLGDLYRYDRMTGENLHLTKSVITGNVSPNKSASTRPYISGDGNTITFESAATDLISGYTGTGNQIYQYKVSTNQMKLISHSTISAAMGGNTVSFNVAHQTIDGRYVPFVSPATDLVAGFVDNNGIANWDTFLSDTLTGQTILVSHGLSSMTTTANSNSIFSAISADGQRIEFGSLATDLVPGFVPPAMSSNSQGYTVDMQTGVITLVSGKYGSATLGGSQPPSILAMSSDGSTVVITTKANDMISGLNDLNGDYDVFVRDVATGTTVCATRGYPSLTPGGDSNYLISGSGFWPVSSADGRYFTYISTATNIVAGQVDAPNTQDVFLFDRVTNISALVSHQVGNAMKAGNGESSMPVISADGRYIAYTSYASNLVAGFVDGNGPGIGGYSGVDTYLYDRVTGTNTLVSHTAANPNAGGNQTSGTFFDLSSYRHSISADGRYVTYFSLANNLVAGFVDNNGTTPSNNTGSDVFVYDRTTGLNTLVSHSTGMPLDGGNDASYAPSISADGRYIAYWSYSFSLVPGMTAVQMRNVFLYDQQTAETTLVSHADGLLTLGSNGWSTAPGISQDGNYIVYSSKGTNVISGQVDTNNQYDMFLYDRQTGTNKLVSHASGSVTMAGNSRTDNEGLNMPRLISGDGRYVTFKSDSTDLVAGFIDGNLSGTQEGDVYVFDRLTGFITLLSHNLTSATTSGNKQSLADSISADGRFVSYYSFANNLLPMTGGFAGNTNAYLYDRLLGTTTLVSHAMSGANVSGDSYSDHSLLSADGSVVGFLSSAGNLVVGDYNSKQDIFAYVTPPPQVTSLKINDGSPQRSVVRSMTISFDEPVFVTGDPALAYSLTRIGSAGSVQLSVVSISNVPNGTVTLSFSGALTQFGSLIDGNYSLSIDASQVSNIAKLDGNGDGVAGDNWVSPPGSIFRLFGDADGNRMVDAVDFVYLRLALGSANFALDGDGTVELRDFIGFRNNFGMMI